MAGDTLWVRPGQLSGSLGSEPDAMEACRAASQIIWALSGRKYGPTRTLAERYHAPRRGRPAAARGAWPAVPGLRDGAVVNRDDWWWSCDDGSRRIRLRTTPVRAVHSVRTEAGTVPAEQYRVLNSGLVEVDGLGPCGDPCWVEVVYTGGPGVPSSGAMAARRLAEEFLLAWTGDDECRLPDRVTNVSREGISFTVMDKQEFLDDLRTGVYEIDLFLRAVNPDRARKRARVFSPDLPRAARVTGGEGYPPAMPVGSASYRMVVRESAALLREFSKTEDGAPVDLTGYEWAAQIRESESQSAPLLLDLAPYMHVDSLDPTVLVLNVPGTVTGALPPFPPGAAWDLFLWPTGDPGAAELLVQGPASLDAASSLVP